MATARRIAVALLVAADLAAGQTAMTTSNIAYAVYRWINYRSSAESTYGHISTWDTSRVTDMSYLFCARSSGYCSSGYYTSSAMYFNDDISAWDVSRVTNMYRMFYYAYDFNQDLSGWNIRAVTSMYNMFYYAYDFNQDLGWCVDNDVSVTWMFYNSGCGSTHGETYAMSRCGVTQQSYCAPPTPRPTPRPTPTPRSDDNDDDNDGREDDTGMFVGIFCAFALAAAWGFHVYRKKKIKRSRGLKKELKGARTELKRMNSELNTYKNAAVGMRVAVTAAGPTAPAPGPVMWYWQESPARLELHPVVKEPHWIPYDAATTNLLEFNYHAGLGPVKLSAAYEADTKAMTQKNVRTGFARQLLRFEPPACKGAAPPPKPPGIAADEPCLVLDPGAIMLIAKQRDDGWAFGSVVMESDATSPSSPGPGWSKNQGWFRMDNTDIPTVDQLADFRDAVEGGEDALAPPKYWDDVKDPTVVEYFRITSKTHADEYERVIGAFMLTLNPSAFTIHSVDRVQNLSLWKTYAAKRAATCSREEDPEKARRRFVRAWLFHGCSSNLAPKILQQGFNRSFCGKHANFFGKGVYFARDASYSTYPLYCAPDAKGSQTVFLVRVVTGEFCKGIKNALTPDLRNVAKNQLYDSTVDNVRDPSIFVTYHDAQAYPEYMIKFTQLKSSVPNEHPAANKPAHRLYRRNLVLDVD